MSEESKLSSKEAHFLLRIETKGIFGCGTHSLPLLDNSLRTDGIPLSAITFDGQKEKVSSLEQDIPQGWLCLQAKT